MQGSSCSQPTPEGGDGWSDRHTGDSDEKSSPPTARERQPSAAERWKAAGLSTRALHRMASGATGEVLDLSPRSTFPSPRAADPSPSGVPAESEPGPSSRASPERSTSPEPTLSRISMVDAPDILEATNFVLNGAIVKWLDVNPDKGTYKSHSGHMRIQGEQRRVYFKRRVEDLIRSVADAAFDDAVADYLARESKIHKEALVFALVTRKPTGGDELARYFLAGSPREQQMWETGVEAILTGKAGRNPELIAAMRNQVSSPKELRRHTTPPPPPASSPQRAPEPLEAGAACWSTLEADGGPGTPSRGRRTSSSSDLGGAMRRVSVSMGLLFSSRRGSTESIGSMAEGSGSTSMAGGGGGEASPRGGGRGSASVSVGGGVGGGGVRSRAASKASRRSGSKFTLRSVGSTASLQSQSSFESSARLDEASVETSCNGNGGNGGGSRRNTGGTTRSFGGAAQPDALVPVPVPVPGGGPPRPEPISESEIAISESLPNGTGRQRTPSSAFRSENRMSTEPRFSTRVVSSDI